MSVSSTPPYRFGDLLALARQSWVQQMTAALADAGYPDYRRTDAATLRLLRRGPVSIGRLGDALAMTRQAARKVAATLEARGYATVERDEHDARQLNAQLTTEGLAYASAVVRAIDLLNRKLAERVSPDELAAADQVLRATLRDEHTRGRGARIGPPDGATS